MKDIYYSLIIVMVFSSVFVACTSDVPHNNNSTNSHSSRVDTLKTRTTEKKRQRLSVKDAFIKLSQQELVLDGLKNMSIQDRKKLFSLKESANYNIEQVGNYLKITEKPENKDDEYEQIEQIRLAVFNSLTQKNILFISQEIIEEQRQKTRIVHQAFLQYNNHHWEDIYYKLPLITTQTFLDNSNSLNIKENHIYFDLQPSDINYLQAHLKHEQYLDKDEIAQNEAYKVALVWTGSDFRLNRQAMVQYDISERHTR